MLVVIVVGMLCEAHSTSFRKSVAERYTIAMSFICDCSGWFLDKLP